MEDNFGLFITLFLGLFGVIKFRELGRFVHMQGKGIFSLMPDKWDILFLQGMFLIVGSLFFIVSLGKLIPLTGIQTSRNLLDWLLVFWGIYIVITFRQFSKLISRVPKKSLSKQDLLKTQIAIIIVGLIFSLIGLTKVFIS